MIGTDFGDCWWMIGTDFDDYQNHLRIVGDFDWLVKGAFV
jgi:hypothetical protein